MKKIATAALIVLAMVPTAVLGTQSRTGALGEASRFILDDSDVFAWPHLSWYYSRGLFLELGIDGSRVSERSSVWGTYAAPERELGVFGLGINSRPTAHRELADFLNRELAVNDSESVRTNIVELLQDRGLGSNLLDIPQPDAAFDALYALRFGKLTAGARLEYASALSRDAYTTSTYEARSSLAGTSLSGGYEFSDDLRVDAGLGYSRNRFGSDYTQSQSGYWEKFQAAGASSVRLDVRGFYMLNEELAAVPSVGVSRTSIKYQYRQSDGLHDANGSSSATEYDFNAGLQFRPSQKLTLLAGLGAGHRNTTIEDSLIAGMPGETKLTRSQGTLPLVSIGLEASITKWLQLRAGASKGRATETERKDFIDNTSRERKKVDQPYELGIGASVKSGNLMLDLVINPELLYSGGNVLSGNKAWPVHMVSAVYRF